MAHSEKASRKGGRWLRFALSGVAFLAGAATLVAPVGASVRSTPPGMSIAFPSTKASVSGPGALVVVRCAGRGGRECAGTLTVEGLSESHTVSYAVAKGERRSLVVPLGSERGFFTGIAAPKMKVVAETMQDSGSSVRTARVLRFK